MKKIIVGLSIVFLTFTISCSIVIKEAGMSDSASSQYITWSHSSSKTIYSVNDEKATYWVQLDNNFVGSYKKFDIEWIAPDGKPFIKSKINTVFGRNDRIIATLPIKDNTPSKKPGNWTVKLSLDGQLIGQQDFTIEDPNKISPLQESPKNTKSEGIEDNLRKILTK